MNFPKTTLTSLIVLLLGCALPMQAQTFSIGPRAGIQYANLTGEGTDTEFMVGWTAGLTSTYSILERSGITVDLLYSVEGAATDPNELRMSYLRLPIFFDLFFGELGQTFRPKMYVGVVPGYLLNAQQSTTDVTSLYKSFDFGLGAGLGFNYQVAEQTWINFDLRYQRGLTDIPEAVFGTPGRAHHQQIQASVGVAFGL